MLLLSLLLYIQLICKMTNMCVEKERSWKRQQIKDFWLKAHQEFAQKCKVRPGAVSEGRDIIPLHPSRDFRHPALAAELHLQTSGITKIFPFLTEWPSASSSKGSHFSPALDIFPFMTQLTLSYGELDSLIKAVGGRNVFSCSSYTFKGINI